MEGIQQLRASGFVQRHEGERRRRWLGVAAVHGAPGLAPCGGPMHGMAEMPAYKTLTCPLPSSSARVYLSRTGSVFRRTKNVFDSARCDPPGPFLGPFAVREGAGECLAVIEVFPVTLCISKLCRWTLPEPLSWLLHPPIVRLPVLRRRNLDNVSHDMRFDI